MTPLRLQDSPLSSGRIGELGSKRVAWSSFSISVAVHGALVVGALAIVPLRRAADPAIQHVDQGIEVFMVPGPPPPEAPVVPQLPETPGSVPGVVGTPEIVQPSMDQVGDLAELRAGIVIPPITGSGSVGTTPAERLQPGMTDRRIWAPLPESFRTLTPEQREEVLIAGRFGEWNDSVAAAAAAAAAWTDWTFADGDGDRWGIRDGQLLLGGLVLPLPQFGASAAQRDYLRSFDELSRQGANAIIQENLRERQEAIRARRDRERALARGDSSSTTPR